MDFEKLESALKNATAELDKAKEQFYKEVGHEVFEVVNAAKLRWTEDVPKVPGWYWMKHQRGSVEIVRLEYYLDIDFTVSYTDTECSDRLSEVDKHTMWAGPIPQPQDAE